MPAKSLLVTDPALDRICFGKNNYLGQPDKAVAEILRALQISDIDALIAYAIKRHWVYPAKPKLNWTAD